MKLMYPFAPYNFVFFSASLQNARVCAELGEKERSQPTQRSLPEYHCLAKAKSDSMNFAPVRLAPVKLQK